MSLSSFQPVAIPPMHIPMLQQVMALLAEHNVSGWLVGGYVRDLLLGQPGHDLDIAVDGPALALARTLADQTGGSFVTLDDATDTARVVWKSGHGDASPIVVDLVRLRAPTIQDDLQLRDFTINALAVPLDDLRVLMTISDVLDPFNGRADLASKQIRQTSPTVLYDDPLRILRAVRFASQLGFSIEATTDGAIRSNVSGIERIAQERVRDELLKLMALRQTAPWLKYLDDVGLLTRILPELELARNCAQPSQHFLPVLGHLLEAVAAYDWLYGQLKSDPLPVTTDFPAETLDFRSPMAVKQHPDLAVALPMADQLLLRLDQPMSNGHQRHAYFKLAVLLHDVGKPVTVGNKPDGRITFYDHQMVGAQMVGKIAQRLRLGRDATSYMQLIVREHMRPGQLRGLGDELTRRALYRFMRDADAAAPDVLLHSLCDHLAARGPYLQQDDWTHHVLWTTAVLSEDWIARPAERPARLINGNDVVQDLGVPAGPTVGRLLAMVEEAQFVGDIMTREEALALAAEIIRRGQLENN